MRRRGNLLLKNDLRIETELQAVLGKLSMLKPGDSDYVKLDQEFQELSKKLRELK